jgi:predicted transcriptional regulator
MTDSSDAASAVTAYLTHSRYGGDSPLQQMVQRKIEHLAQEIADEIVSSTPQLREVIEKKTRAVIEMALEDDRELRRGVVKAVAEALSVRRPEDDD